MKNPYDDLDDYHFWRRAISHLEPYRVDPVVAPKFIIQNSDLVSTAGSCFAQHISRKLSALGFNYYVPEQGLHLNPVDRLKDGYGVFSARFGNIYTIRQLLQLFEEAFEIRAKSESLWFKNNGIYVDPFRSGIDFSEMSQDEILKDRQLHLGCVREMFLNSDVFIFTLGLTESWINSVSGDVFPLAPGVSGGSYDPTIYQFVNFNIDDSRDDLRLFLHQLKNINSKIKVLLTVSPVPLVATFENCHVLTATTYSKSVLRVVAEIVKQEFDWVDYFPSYEIITGSFNWGKYYEHDLRQINNRGVTHVMRCFLKNYTTAIEQDLDSTFLMVESKAMKDIVCDEELINLVSVESVFK